LSVCLLSARVIWVGN